MGERLEPRAPARGGAAYALGDRADQPVLAGQQGDDPVGLPQLVGAQDDRLVAIEGHPPIVPRSAAGAAAAPGPTPGRSSSQQAERERRRRARSSRSGRDPPLQDAGRLDELGVRHLARPASRRRRRGWIGSDGCPTTRAGAVIARRSREDGRDTAEEDAVDDGRDRARGAGRGCRARCRPRTAPVRAARAGSASAAP